MNKYLRRRLAGLAACVAAAAAPLASAQTTVSLNATDACLNAGDMTLTVTIDMTGASDVAVGGQFFLEYDTAVLEFVDAGPGSDPFLLEIFQAHDGMAGTIDYAVGVVPGDDGTAADTTMAVLTFNVLGVGCDLADLVTFRKHDPPTAVTNDMGTNHLAGTNDLGPVTIDVNAPVLTLTSGLSATDNCGDAPTLPGIGTFQFSTDGAVFSGSDGGGTCDAFGPGMSPDVWYMFVSPMDGTLSVTTCGLTDYDTVLEILTDCGGATIACNDDSGCPGFRSTVIAGVKACVPVMIRMAGFSGDTGSGFIAVTVAPLSPPTPPGPMATDLCGDAPPFGEGVFPFSTVGAGDDGSASCGSANTTADVWVQYVPTATGMATAQTCGTANYDSVISSHATPCDAVSLFCNDDGCAPHSRITFPATMGTPVWVRVSGWNGSTGSGTLLISLVPASPPAPAFTLDRTVKADAGACTAIVTFGATATDDCDPNPSVVCDMPSGSAFPIGTTAVSCMATDACGSVTFSGFDVTVLPVNEMVAEVELAGADAGSYTRCITFDLSLSGDCPVLVSEEKTLWFTDGRTRSVVDVPCGLYDCSSARDRLHTLRRTDDEFGIVGTRYVTNYTTDLPTDDSLVGGNLNDDRFVEILDFGVFVGQFGVNYGSASTTCGTSAPHADISGDGVVALSDYTFIMSNFLQAREADCCGMASTGGPRDDISVDELVETGQADLVIADLNGDGRLNSADVAAFLNGERPCPADWNRDAHVNSADFFSFLTAFFNGSADFNRDDVTNSQDFFTFLNEFFSGCH